ncbi:hypothetical protein WN943_008197 [Citrus x changshan-huyou]
MGTGRLVPSPPLPIAIPRGRDGRKARPDRTRTGCMKNTDPGIDFQCPAVSGHGSANPKSRNRHLLPPSLHQQPVSLSHHPSFTDGDAVLTVDRASPSTNRKAQSSLISLSNCQRARHCLVSFSAAAIVRRRPPP